MAEENNNIIVHHNEMPVCSHQLIAYLLSKELTTDILIFFAWANFYLHGLWDDRGREEIEMIADYGYYGDGYHTLLPWLTEKEPMKSRWYPARLESERQQILVRQQYDHWNKLCFKSKWYYVTKSAEKGLMLRCRVERGLKLRDAFDTENSFI